MGNQASINIDTNSNNIDLRDMNLSKLPFNPILENKVKYLYLSGNKFTSLPENLNELIVIDLSRNQMKSLMPINVSKALMTYSNLKTLYLSDNQLTNFNDFFESKSIETLDLLQNRFSEFPNNFFVKLPNLKTLYFDCNFLKVFPKQQSETLSSLTMSLNNIESIELSSIVFSQLASLDLSKNKIQKIPKDFSKSFPILHDINLSNNFISELPGFNGNESIFPNSLKEINLSNNSIEKITNSITSLQNLTVLNIQNNKIKTVPQLPQSIQKLNLSYNKIESFSEQTLNMVKEFDLSYNELTRFPTEIKMPQLSTFSIDHNKITSMDFGSVPFKKFFPKSVTSIDISFNKIDKLEKKIFTKLPNLTTLIAYFNRITEIPSEISECRKLCYLDISFNPIKKFPKLPRSLLRILASNCQIDSFENPFVEPQSITETAPTAEQTESSSKNQPTSQSSIHLRTVDLSGNRLESFPDLMTIQTLNLSQNKIKKMPQLTNTIRILDLSMNDLESNSSSMPEFISSTSLVDLNLSHNKLASFPKFQNVPLFQYLEISGNPLSGALDMTGLAFLERIDISQTNVMSIEGTTEMMNEVITSKSDFSILTKPKIDVMKSKASKPNLSSPMNRPLYVNQKNNKKSGFSEILGLRSSMEDSIIVRDDLNLYAVCDGHGGPDTAKFVAIQLADFVEKTVRTKAYSFNKAKEFILNIFNQTEKVLQKQNLPDGSTICLSFICDNKKIVTAHLGDARALIIRSDGKSRELTRDHKPGMRSEFDRIHNEFARLAKDERVDGLLAVARSMGDFRVKGVGREPEVNEFDIDQNDKFLVIGCDGVFDVLSNDDVASVAFNASSPTEAAFNIRNAAFGSSSSDNISVIVVDLNSK
ncbi:hypothetical protein M9Y10_036276 [Tritrichomonas musculus]|uniref:PPM-type phosphatase domain-containing protein n=1 Tax=Tritrichomonas musculus TaxID=1915356 RepID=A0ABR2GVR0_9EUKA